MGFQKYANASIKKADINLAAWDEVRQKQPAGVFNKSSSKVVLQDYNPKEFLLSHCTIIASVDTEEAGMSTGRQLFDGQQIDRKYADFYITPDTSKYVNNNNDSWERKLLLSSFRTFIDGENYVEHIQIPALSKGKIIDAAARDLGDTVYVDILVATNKKHAALIDAITTGKLSTLSMGAQVEFTLCSKCGNVASDELQLCNHIKYFKGNEFVDAFGKKRKIAELCGHIKAEPGSVRFIEASWVANPAFPGAVLRNILSADALSVEASQKIQAALSKPARELDDSSMLKAARTLSAEEQQQFPGAEGDQQETQQSGPLDKAVDDLYTEVKNKVVEHIRDDLSKEDAAKVRKVLDENQNETLIKSAIAKDASWGVKAKQLLKTTGRPSLARRFLAGLIMLNDGGWKRVVASGQFSGRELLVLDRVANSFSKRATLAGETRIYQTVIAVGGVGAFENVDGYLAACRRVAGRELTSSEQSLLVTKGMLYSLGS